MTPALVAAAIAAPLLRPEQWSAVALQQASSPDGALHCSTAPNECKHSARASTGSRWPTEEVHARTLWPCTADGGGLSSVSAEPAALHSRRGSRVTHGAAPCTLMQCSNDASQCRCTRAVAHRGARCNPVHHHRDAPRCRCTQVVVHRGARCTTVHGGARDHQIVSQNPSSTGLDFRV